MKRLFIAAKKEALERCFTESQMGTSRVVSTEEFYRNPSGYSDVEFIFSTWGMPQFSEEEIRRYFPNLKAVFYAAGSVAAFARPFFHCNVRIFSAWAANAIPVAEFTAAQIILANKGYFQMAGRYRKGVREAVDYAESFPGNYGTRVGIIGLGMISTHVIRLLNACQLELYVYSLHLTEADAKRMGVHKAELDEIFETCQTISNHLANKPETVGCLNGRLFSRMKPNATLINTGRGAQVDMEALKQAMREEPGRTALLDVTDPEPVDAEDDVWEIPNIFLTPHRAGSMTAEVRRMGQYMMEAYEAFSDGTPAWEVKEEMLDTMA